jgi:anti-sigma factor RsiW
MTHDDLNDLAMALHDGQLSPADKALAEAHLAGCPECRRELESWKRAAIALFQGALVAPSETFVRRVMRGIEAESRPSAWARLRSLRTPRWAWAGAFAAAAAAALWLFLPRSFVRSVSAEKPDIIAEMSDVSVEAMGSDTEGYGTSVETYLL